MFLCRINNDILVMLFAAKGDENIIFERMQKGDSDVFEYFLM